MANQRVGNCSDIEGGSQEPDIRQIPEVDIRKTTNVVGRRYVSGKRTELVAIYPCFYTRLNELILNMEGVMYTCTDIFQTDNQEHDAR